MKPKGNKIPIPSQEIFIQNVRSFFSALTERYDYEESNIINETMYVVITYENNSLKRRIEIKNETYSIDYGFSIFIYNTTNEEYNIAVNIPWDKEDEECKFVERSSKFFFETLKSQIDGSEWKEFGRILKQE